MLCVGLSFTVVDLILRVICHLYRDSTKTRDIVVIGSHSHWLAALDVNTGVALWEVELNERVESSASLSSCGRYVIVGERRL